VSFIGGKADRGALQRAFQVSVAGLFFVILVFWISPALSNYAMMNLFLFAELSFGLRRFAAVDSPLSPLTHSRQNGQQ
jgi:hypothetical protein